MKPIYITTAITSLSFALFMLIGIIIISNYETAQSTKMTQVDSSLLKIQDKIRAIDDCGLETYYQQNEPKFFSECLADYQ